MGSVYHTLLRPVASFARLRDLRLVFHHDCMLRYPSVIALLDTLSSSRCRPTLLTVVVLQLLSPHRDVPEAHDLFRAVTRFVCGARDTLRVVRLGMRIPNWFLVDRSPDAAQFALTMNDLTGDALPSPARMLPHQVSSSFVAITTSHYYNQPYFVWRPDPSQDDWCGAGQISPRQYLDWMNAEV